MKEIRERGLNKDQRMAMTWRVMHFGGIFEHQERLAAFIRPSPGGEPGAVEVSEALIRGGATARIEATDDDVSYDIDDLVRIATEIERAHEGN